MSLSLSEYREAVNRLLARQQHAATKVTEEKTALSTARAALVDIQTAQDVLQQVAQSVQQQAHDRIASVVSRCLSAVFADEAYEFRIHFERKRGRTEARIVFARDGHEVSPTSGSGGGVLDVAAFALRLACLMMSKPACRRTLIMDEPFRFVHSPIYRERVRLMLETLAEEMDFQFIISTGCPDYQTGTIVEV